MYKFIKDHVDFGSEGSVIRNTTDQLAIVEEYQQLMAAGANSDLQEELQDKSMSPASKLPFLSNQQERRAVPKLPLKNEKSSIIGIKKLNLEDYIHKNMVKKTRAEVQVYNQMRNQTR